jgi:chorismate-pyruvate lyase
LEDLFIAQGQKPAGLQPVDLAALQPIQRVLLVADGTMTHMIEVLALEPMEVLLIAQEIRRLRVENPWLAVAGEIELCEREVVLRGAQSGTPHIYATATIAMDRVPAEVARCIERGNESIGRALLQSGIEYRRERLWYGIEYPDSLPEPVQSWAAGGVLSRTYRIVAGGRPLMLIDEKFPLQA